MLKMSTVWKDRDAVSELQTHNGECLAEVGELTDGTWEIEYLVGRGITREVMPTLKEAKQLVNLRWNIRDDHPR